MKGRSVWLVTTASLLALLGLAFFYPAAMVSPGPVVPSHAAIASECLACHVPFRGVSPAQCGKCHVPSDIGLRTTTGSPLRAHAERPAFHQQLSEQNCIACHTDHVGSTLGQRSKKPFSHGLVRADTRERCETCHAAPKNDLHRELGVNCAQCHKTEHWKPATFEHAALAKTALERCEGCHKTPTSGSRAHLTGVSGQCQQCHTTEHWKPASFEHGKFFELDRNHAASCVTCHNENNYKRYTCYGCHEHTPDKIRAEHEEEGIGNLDNCVSCHKSPGGEHGERGEHGEGRRREH